MRLLLVRHGESQFNAEGRIQGQLDVPLSPLGLEQAQALAAALADRSIDAVYSSPLMRAMQTAAPIADPLGIEVKIEERLREIDAGIFQGMLWSEIRTRYPVEAARWIAQEPDFAPPDGETRRELMRRGLAALNAIRQSGHKQVVVVSHGGLLCSALKAALDIPAERVCFQLRNASISRVDWQSQFRLMTLNETGHLGPLAEQSGLAIEAGG